MPGRRDSFVNDGIYHVFNRTIDGKIIFAAQELANPFLGTLTYYRSSLVDRSYSHYKILDDKYRILKQAELSAKKYFYIDILAYCLMPTHFHLILQQLQENGVRKYMANTVNSFTRFFNTKFQRKGPLFLPRFQSREIITDEVLMHVSRYIHLNPYSQGIVTRIENLPDYSLSSYEAYIQNSFSGLANIIPVLNLFKKDIKSYKLFVENQADYQKTLEQLKYLEKW